MYKTLKLTNLSMLLSSSVKNNELHGIPQFFTVFPPILNSAPIAEGIFN